MARAEVQNVDQESFDELVQTYAAEHPFDELDYAGVLLLAWRQCGGTGALAEVYAWADAVPSHWRATRAVLRASGWVRRRSP